MWDFINSYVSNTGNAPTTKKGIIPHKNVKERKALNNCLRKTSNNNKSLHCPQLDHHDADGLTGQKKTWRTTQTTLKRYKYAI
jgi:hypothetical protein